MSVAGSRTWRASNDARHGDSEPFGPGAVGPIREGKGRGGITARWHTGGGLLRDDDDRVLGVTDERHRYRSDDVMVGVHGAADNDDDGGSSPWSRPTWSAAASKFMSDVAVTALETPARLDAVQPASDRLGELLLEGIEPLERFNLCLGRELRARGQVGDIDDLDAPGPARDQLGGRVECSIRGC